jgi:hypothetical protein
MEEPAWDDNRINDNVARIADANNRAWTETLRFMRDSYEARLEQLRAENEQLRTALIEAGDVLFTNEVLRFRATRLVSLEELEAACEVINQALKGK